MHISKHILLIAVIIFCSSALVNAQEVFLQFYDSSWKPSSQKEAYYVTQNIKAGNVFLKKTYWVESQKLYSASTGPDTLLRGKRYGLYTTYFENGGLHDSSLYNNAGRPIFSYKYFDDGRLADDISYNEKGQKDSAKHFYKNGGLKVRFVKGNKRDNDIIQAFDENGNAIPDFIYEKEAEFKSGDGAWQNYLAQNIDPATPVRNNAPVGVYVVIARFIIDKDGTVKDVQAETKFGYGMEEEVIRALRRSPKWKPAMQYNKPVNAYRRQPITFKVAMK